MTLIDTDIAEIVQGVWEAMLGLEIELVPDAATEAGDDYVTGSVTVTGAADSVVTLQLTRSGAQAFAAEMFGSSADEVSSDEVADAVGELTNMVGGNIKSLLPEPSMLSLPTVSSGEAVRVRVRGGGALTRVTLLCGAEVVVVHVWGRQVEPTRPEMSAAASASV